MVLPPTLDELISKNHPVRPLKDACHKGAGNRIKDINHNLNRLKQQADALLKSEVGIKKRTQRCIEKKLITLSVVFKKGLTIFNT